MLRAWQERALAAYFGSGARDFLLLATPGGGKTRFAIEVAARLGMPTTVVCPSINLRHQWHKAGLRAGVKLRAVTYQAVLRKDFAPVTDGLVVFDEIHHASESNTWGERSLAVFSDADRRLCLTGTAFRSDDVAIPFVSYVDGECKPDFAYGYSDAVLDGIVRRIEWPVWNGDVMLNSRLLELADTEGNEFRAAYAACLEPEGEFMASMLRAAHERLLRFPSTDGGLVIARDCDAANRVAEVLRRIVGDDDAVKVVHDKTKFSADKIKLFRAGRGRWLVSVKMVSEGVDIPRLRVLAYATNISTELFFRQAMGRIVRGTGIGVCYLPHHPILREYMARMDVERLHQAVSTASAVGDVEPVTRQGLGSGARLPGIYSRALSGWEHGVVKIGRPELLEAQRRHFQRIKECVL